MPTQSCSTPDLWTPTVKPGNGAFAMCYVRTSLGSNHSYSIGLRFARIDRRGRGEDQVPSYRVESSGRRPERDSDHCLRSVRIDHCAVLARPGGCDRGVRSRGSVRQGIGGRRRSLRTTRRSGALYDSAQRSTRSCNTTCGLWLAFLTSSSSRLPDRHRGGVSGSEQGPA